MGIFKKNTEELDAKRAEWVVKKHEKARDTLTKKGVLLDELIMLDDSFDDGAYEYLLIFPDRVEYINTGKVGTLTKKGKGTEVIPISRISSVQTRKKVIFEILLKSNTYSAPFFTSGIFSNSVLDKLKQ